MSKNSASHSEQFRKAVGEVRPLKAEQRHHDPAARPRLPRVRQATADEAAPSIGGPQDAALQARVAEACLASGALLRDGLPRKVLRKLGSAECPAEDTIDLHGLTARQAAGLLSSLLEACIHSQLRCIRVIHGKGLRSGGPAILKLQSWQQLWRHPAVLALKPCDPAEGGSGAVLVLLSSPQDCR